MLGFTRRYKKNALPLITQNSGNPCFVPNKELLNLKGKARVQTIVCGNTEIPVDNSIRRNKKK
jgi:hypothetical protein